MDGARFRALLASFGADLARWPETERQQAEEFAASSAEATRWLAEERRLDELLDAAPDLAVSPMLLRRVAEIPIRHRHPGTAPELAQVFGRLRNWLMGLAAVAAMGAVVGVVTPEPSSRGDAQIADELSPLVWAGDLSEELEP
jgi:hypothetical protein